MKVKFNRHVVDYWECPACGHQNEEWDIDTGNYFIVCDECLSEYEFVNSDDQSKPER